MIDNPMLRHMTTEECLDAMPDEEIEELKRCEYCGERVYFKYKNMHIHKDCYAMVRAEARGEI